MFKVCCSITPSSGFSPSCCNNPFASLNSALVATLPSPASPFLVATPPPSEYPPSLQQSLRYLILLLLQHSLSLQRCLLQHIPLSLQHPSSGFSPPCCNILLLLSLFSLQHRLIQHIPLIATPLLCVPPSRCSIPSLPYSVLVATPPPSAYPSCCNTPSSNLSPSRSSAPSSSPPFSLQHRFSGASLTLVLQHPLPSLYSFRCNTATPLLVATPLSIIYFSLQQPTTPPPAYPISEDTVALLSAFFLPISFLFVIYESRLSLVDSLRTRSAPTEILKELLI